jgi:hypothetical protein
MMSEYDLPVIEYSGAELRAMMESRWRCGGVYDARRPQRWTTRHLHATRGIGGNLIDFHHEEAKP